MKYADDEDDGGDKKDSYMRAPSSKRKLTDLDVLPFTELHCNIINTTAFAHLKDLSSFSMHPVLLKTLLRCWHQEGSSESFKLGSCGSF